MTNGSRRETGGPYFNTEWCRVLRAQQDAIGISRAQLAEATKIARRTLERIMVGERVPDATELIALCRALDLPVLRMLATIDVVPGITRLLDYVTQLEEMASLTQLNATLVGVDQIHGATVIANKVVATGRYRAAIQPLWQGTGWRRRHYADLVAFNPIFRGESDNMRTVLKEILRGELGWFTAGFLGFPETARDFFDLPTPRLSEVINVPRFLAIRRGNGIVATTPPDRNNPRTGLPERMPHSICVLGSHWSGSADVACFLGYAFDYDYTHVGFTAARAYSRLTDEWHHELFDHDRLEVARTFFYGAELGRRRVWATGGDGDIGGTAELIGDPHNSAPIVVHLRVTDRLMEWATRTRTRFSHTGRSYDDDLSFSRRERQRIDTALRRIPGRTVTIDVDLPSEHDFTNPDDDGRDAFFDLWADLSLIVLEALKTQLGLPFDLSVAREQLMAGGAYAPDTV